MVSIRGNGKTMNNEKLNEIGEKLDVAPEDTARLRKQKLLMRIFAPVLGVLGIIASLIAGYFVKRTVKYKPITYPYAVDPPPSPLGPWLSGGFAVASLIGIVFLTIKHKKNRATFRFLLGTLIVTTILSILSFFSGYAQGSSNESVMYGVYSMERKIYE